MRIIDIHKTIYISGITHLEGFGNIEFFPTVDFENFGSNKFNNFIGIEGRIVHVVAGTTEI
jgi:hypothetical protein